MLGVLMTTTSETSNNAAFTAERAALLREIDAHVRESASRIGRDRLSPEVHAAMGKVPRHEFVPESLQRLAYRDRPLPIGGGQTISQPYIVAVMTELLELPDGARVLEIGTGSGYQAAVLAELADEVYSIEILPELAAGAAAVLARLGYANVDVRSGDGYAGWPEHAPFDGIIVTAAAPEVPPPLLDQLRPGGRMVIPVEGGFGAQDLLVIEKTTDGQTLKESVLPVRFVPFTRDPASPAGPAHTAP